MFYPVKMCKVRVVGLRKDLPSVINALHNYGGVQLHRFRHDSFEEDKPLECYGAIVEQLVKLERALKLLEEQEKVVAYPSLTLKQTLKKSERLALLDRLQQLNEKLEGISNEKSNLRNAFRRVGFFKNVHIDFSRLQSDLVELFGGRIYSGKTKLVESTLSKITEKHSLVSKPYQKGQDVLVVAIEKASAVKAKNALDKIGFVEEALPEVEGKPSEALNNIHKRINALEAQEKGIGGELSQLSKKHYTEVMALIELLRNEKEKAEASIDFGRTKDSFAFEAFLPEESFARAREVLAKTMGEKAMIAKISSQELAEKHEHAPTLLKHSEPVQPFKFLIEFIDLPQDWEIDPTLVFMIFFPIFYGMMLGDFGYALISILIALGLRKVSPPGSMLRPFANMWAYCAVPAAIFGIIYDEYLGFSHHKIFELLGFPHVVFYHGIERLHNIELLLPIAIITGVAALSFGFILGALNALKEKEYWHAAAKVGWFGLLLSGTMAVSSGLFGIYPALLVPSVAVMVISFLPILKAEGPIAAIEIPSVAGNCLSFARILAVGLASVVVAAILNDLVLPNAEQGFFLLITLPLYVFGHVFNTFLGMFEGLIQGARLNYVEFFSKFYHGGGKAFMPFRAKRKYTKE